ncbi:MAG: hypothetical protein Q4E24_13350 [bacterium]|nr:hypothetical protein [bacterium]
MNDSERIRRKKIWEALTDDERKAAEKKRDEIVQWTIEENNKALEKIKKEGRYVGGLDGQYPELKEISEEGKRRMDNFLSRLFTEDMK